jgi:uncharacterized membrane protein
MLEAPGGTGVPELVAIAYPDETLAERAARELRRCEQLLVDQDAASVLICERDGSFRLTTSGRDGESAEWSRFWGAVLGSLLSGEDPAGLGDPFRDHLRHLLRPGASVLLFAAPRPGWERALAALSHFGGEALASPLSRG